MQGTTNMPARGGIAIWEDLAAVNPAVARTHVLLTQAAAVAPLAPAPDDACEASMRKDGDLFLLRRAALRRFVAAVVGGAPETVMIGRAQHGAPTLVALPGWRVSISARGDHAAFAVSTQPVGVDLERVGAPQEPAWNVLAKSERGALAALAPQARHVAFLELWTAKEAYLKARGVGLAREPAEIAASLGGDRFSIRDGGRIVASEAMRWRRGDALVACVVL